jgi:anti-sigma B factor antagonist
MEITVKEYGLFDLITIAGRVDSVEASRLAQTLNAANDRGQYKLVIDMSKLEYMSSAGLRALTSAQRNSQNHDRGEVILAEVPASVREVLEVVGFTDFFTILDSVSSAKEFAANLSQDGATRGSKPSTS